MIQNIDGNNQWWHQWKKFCEQKNLKLISVFACDAYGRISMLTIPEMTNGNIEEMLLQAYQQYKENEKPVILRS